MAITINAHGVRDNMGGTYAPGYATPESYVNSGQFGSPSTWKSHAVTSVTSNGTGQVRIVYLDAFDSDPRVIASGYRNSNSATITTIDANVSTAYVGEYSIRTSSGAGGNVNYFRLSAMNYR